MSATKCSSDAHSTTPATGGDDARRERAEQLDARGLKCPEPLMVVRAAMRKLSNGDLLRVLATDPSTSRDIPSYCRFVHHTLLDAWRDGEEFHFLLQKGE